MRQSINLSNSLQGEYEDKKPLLSFTPSHVHLMAHEKSWKFFRHLYRLTFRSSPHHNYVLESAPQVTTLPKHIRVEREWEAPNSPFFKHFLRLKTKTTWFESELIANPTKIADNTYVAPRKSKRRVLILQIVNDMLVVDSVPWIGRIEGQRFKELLKIHPYYFTTKKGPCNE